jgi:hypothetical protein
MRNGSIWHREKAHVDALPAANVFIRDARELCEKALNDAKIGLHPLLRSMDVNRLDGRKEFIHAFRSAFERRIAKRLALWQPGVQAVFKFEETLILDDTRWDGTIHLLAKVARVSDSLKLFGKKLDKNLCVYLREIGWSRFKERRSILDVQQVTLTELRHGVSYGAMFHAVYNRPIQVWPLKKEE